MVSFFDLRLLVALRPKILNLGNHWPKTKIKPLYKGGKFGGTGEEGTLETPGGTQDYSGSVKLILPAVVGGCR